MRRHRVEGQSDGDLPLKVVEAARRDRELLDPRRERHRPGRGRHDVRMAIRADLNAGQVRGGQLHRELHRDFSGGLDLAAVVLALRLGEGDQAGLAGHPDKGLLPLGNLHRRDQIRHLNMRVVIGFTAVGGRQIAVGNLHAGQLDVVGGPVGRKLGGLRVRTRRHQRGARHPYSPKANFLMVSAPVSSDEESVSATFAVRSPSDSTEGSPPRTDVAVPSSNPSSGSRHHCRTRATVNTGERYVV